jgi:hypothetical protein
LQLLLSEKSAEFAPPMAMELMLSAALPVFVRVTDWAGEVWPTAVAGNAKLPVDSIANGYENEIVA